MKLRSTIVLAGTLMAIIAPVASAHIAPDPQNQQSQPLSQVRDYAGLLRESAATASNVTENSYGASRPQTRPVRSNAKAKVAKTKIVSLNRESGNGTGPIVGAPDDDCTYMLNTPDCS